MNPLGAHAADREVVAAQHIHSAVTHVIPQDQATHGVGDHIHFQRRIIVIPTNLLDQPMQLAGGGQIVLSPVVGEDIVACRRAVHRCTRLCTPIAGGIFQRAYNATVKIPPGDAIEQASHLQGIRPGFTGQRQRQVTIIGEHQPPQTTRPDFLTCLPLTVGRHQATAHDAGHHNHRRRHPGFPGLAIKPVQIRLRL